MTQQGGPVGNRCRGRTKAAPAWNLFAQAEVGDQRGVAVGVLVLQVGQQALALVDHAHQAAAAVVVLQVLLEVRHEFIDARGEQRHLNFGGAGVGSATGVGLDDFGLGGGGHGHGGFPG